MPALNSSQTQPRAEEDTFAQGILDREVLRLASTSVQATTMRSRETQKQKDEWQTLCRSKGWNCRVCRVYPKYGNSLGYEDGLCPVHRLTSHAE